ncbi:MAG TPA: DUF3892 domain-containing protein [Candidatus Eremiobacteraceae bacterium]|nr:DUF3892 domain-containing protein [Candidatus Eremiobacteraceae bacterium]
MTTYYVKCINKHPTHSDPHRRIQHIGTNESRPETKATKKWTVAEVVSAIEDDGDIFYCHDDEGDWVLVEVATHDGHAYVKTENDGIQPDNLLAQRECGGPNW